MHIYKHKVNGKIYTIENVIYHKDHYNSLENAGVYAMQYRGGTDRIVFKCIDPIERQNFINENFEIIETLKFNPEN